MLSVFVKRLRCSYKYAKVSKYLRYAIIEWVRADFQEVAAPARWRPRSEETLMAQCQVAQKAGPAPERSSASPGAVFTPTFAAPRSTHSLANVRRSYSHLCAANEPIQLEKGSKRKKLAAKEKAADTPEENDAAKRQYGQAAPDAQGRWTGSQDFVQAKLLEVIELIRQEADPGTPIPADVQAFGALVNLNGLCAGFVEIHKQDPEWIEELWAAISSWTVPAAPATPTQKLDSLNTHLDDKVPWAKGRGRFELRRLLTEAFRFMDRVESDADYGLVPASLGVRGDLPKAPEGGKTKKLTVHRPKAGREMVQYIQSAIGEGSVHCIAAIETKTHAMSVRINRTAKSLTLKVVETVKSGIVTAESWDEVMAVLQLGLFLDPTEPDEKQVTIQIFKEPGGKKQ
jgi:hypothetical protein